MAGDPMAVLETLGIQKAHFVGASMGGDDFSANCHRTPAVVVEKRIILYKWMSIVGMVHRALAIAREKHQSGFQGFFELVASVDICF